MKIFALCVSALMCFSPQLRADSFPSLELEVGREQMKLEQPLGGQWAFYMQRFFSDQELRDQVFLGETWASVKVPETSWHDQNPELPSFGFASYIVRVKGLQSLQESLAGRMSQFVGTHRLRLLFPRNQLVYELSSSGILAKNASDFVNQIKRQVFDLPRSLEDEAYLIVDISSYIIVGGLRDVPVIGSREEIRESERKAEWRIFTILGMFSMLMLIYFGIFLLRPADRPSLLMLAVSCCLFLRFICTESVFSMLFPQAHFLLGYIHLYLIIATLAFSVCFYLEFLFYSFPGFLLRRALNLCWLVTLFVLHVSVLIPTQAWWMNGVLWSIVLPVAFWQFSGLWRAYKQGFWSSLFAITGMGLLIAAIAFDFCVFINLIHSPYLGPYAMVIFTFMQSLVVGANFSRAYRTADRLSHHLKQEVEIQTYKLQLQKDKLEEQKKELVKAHDDLREADQQRTRFFRSISHELRTPLTLILGSLAVTERAFPQDENLPIVRRNANRLYRLVNQLLDFQKMALSQSSLRLEPVELRHLVMEIGGYFHQACAEKDVQFEIVEELKEQKNYWILAQVDALEKIVFNYLANALKFSPKGGLISLILSIKDHSIVLSVRDEGPGIDPVDQNRLFHLFSQIDSPQQKEKQGTGLGLALVRELSEHMRGEVGVNSQLGFGAEFWVKFPLHEEKSQWDILMLGPNSEELRQLVEVMQVQFPEIEIFQTQVLNIAVEQLQKSQVKVLIASSEIGVSLGPLLSTAQSSSSCWKVVLGHKDKNSAFSLKTLQAETIDAWYEWPVKRDFLQDIAAKLQDRGLGEKPILDLVYVEDEAVMREDFHTALAKYTLLDRVKIVSDGASLKALLQQYRIRVVVADERLEAERGVELLSYVRQVSPDSFRILLTGETSQELVATGIKEAQVHYIIYKPADLQKEAAVFEDYIARSTIQESQVHSREEREKEKSWHWSDLDQKGGRTQEMTGLLTAKPIGAKAVILVVDDVLDMRAMIGQILRQHTFHVAFASDGLEALELLKQHPREIDLLVCDWLMPGMNGPELIQKIKQNEELSSLPTILLTAKTDSESKFQGTRLGASAYIGKPFDEMELISTVENLLDLKKRERKISELHNFISQHVLQRFLPPDLVEDLIEGKAQLNDKPEMRKITVLFADLVDFTRSTEKLGVEKIAKILNAFLVDMTDIIFHHGGTIDKFMGDGILVFFGAPRQMEKAQQVLAATRCAEEMQKKLALLNQLWQESDVGRFQMRIGLHHGPAIVGSFGGERRADYTAVGQTVNIASRVEAQAEPGTIYLTEEIAAELNHKVLQWVGSFTLKGLDTPFNLYRLEKEQAKREVS